MRWLLYSQITLAVLAALAIVSADRLDQPKLIYVGALCLGGLVVLAGIDSIVTRHVRFFDVSIGSSTYEGLAAQFWGIAFVGMGGAIIAFGVSGFTSLAERSLIEAIAEQPGIVLLGLSAVFLGTGGATLLGPIDQHASRWDLFLSAPYRLAGLILIGLGLGVLILGLVAVTVPSRFDEVVTLLIQTLFRVLG